MRAVARLLVLLVLGSGLTVGAISALEDLGEGLIPPKKQRQAVLEETQQGAQGAARAAEAGAGEIAGAGGDAATRAGDGK